MSCTLQNGLRLLKGYSGMVEKAIEEARKGKILKRWRGGEAEFNSME